MHLANQMQLKVKTWLLQKVPVYSTSALFLDYHHSKDSKQGCPLPSMSINSINFQIPCFIDHKYFLLLLSSSQINQNCLLLFLITLRFPLSFTNCLEFENLTEINSIGCWETSTLFFVCLLVCAEQTLLFSRKQNSKSSISAYRKQLI